MTKKCYGRVMTLRLGESMAERVDQAAERLDVRRADALRVLVAVGLAGLSQPLTGSSEDDSAPMPDKPRLERTRRPA